MYCLCLNVYCITATGWKPNCSGQIYQYIKCQKVLQNGRLIRFSKRTECWCPFSWSVCNQNGHSLRSIQSSIFQGYGNIHTRHGKTSSAKRNSQKPKLSERDHRTLKRIVSINHRSTAAKVIAELDIHLEDHFYKKSDESFTNPTSMVELQLLNLWLLKTVLKGEKDGVMITKPGHLMIGNTQYGQMSHPSCCSWHRVGFIFGHRPRKPIILNAWFQLWNMEPDPWWFWQQYLVFCCSCTYSEWSNYCHWLRGHFR